MIDVNDKAEFLGQIIDIFEDFLTEKKAERFNDEPQEENNPDIQVYFYGNDYDELENALAEMMKRWEIIK